MTPRSRPRDRAVANAPGSRFHRSALGRLDSCRSVRPYVNQPSEWPPRHLWPRRISREPDFGDALKSALSEISGRAALNCELPIPHADGDAVDPQRVNVIYSPADGTAPKVVPKDDRGGCDQGANGWQYTDSETRIRLCGPACDVVREDRGGRIDVVLGCPVRGPD